MNLFSKTQLVIAAICLTHGVAFGQNPSALDAPNAGTAEVVRVNDDGKTFIQESVELEGDGVVEFRFRETSRSGGDTKIVKGRSNSLVIKRFDDRKLYTLGSSNFIVHGSR